MFKNSLSSLSSFIQSVSIYICFCDAIRWRHGHSLTCDYHSIADVTAIRWLVHHSIADVTAIRWRHGHSLTSRPFADLWLSLDSWRHGHSLTSRPFADVTAIRWRHGHSLTCDYHSIADVTAIRWRHGHSLKLRMFYQKLGKKFIENEIWGGNLASGAFIRNSNIDILLLKISHKQKSIFWKALIEEWVGGGTLWSWWAMQIGNVCVTWHCRYLFEEQLSNQIVVSVPSSYRRVGAGTVWTQPILPPKHP